MSNAAGSKSKETMALARDFAQKFYAEANVFTALSQADSDIIAYGAQSLTYARGLDAVSRLLQAELGEFSPARLFRLHLRPSQDVDGNDVVSGFVVLHESTHNSSLVYQIALSYRQADGAWQLTGIHIDHNRYIERKYQAVCSRMVGDAITAMEEDLPKDALLHSHIRAAYVTYTLAAGKRKLGKYSDEFWQMFGFSSAEQMLSMIDNEDSYFVSAAARKRLRESIAQQLEKRDVYQVEYQIDSRAGSVVWILECGRAVLSRKGKEYHCILLDITSLKRARESLAYQVAYDELTGLFSKQSFYNRVRSVLDEQPSGKFEIMAFDIERFKILNDLFGEEVGDFVLRSIAQCVRRTQDAQCVSARLHSDKFVIFYPANNHNRERFVRELRAVVAGFSIGSRVTLRFGVYAVNDSSLTVSKMCGRAFLAAVQAKEHPRSEYNVYAETMWRTAVAEQNIINQMERALENSEFVLYMQPKYDLSSETVVGAEALVRWIHPTRGLVSPAEFIPVFERSGFICQLDHFVWEHTCQLLRKWIDEGRNPPAVSVNVSRVDFFNADLVNVLGSLVSKYRLPPKLLELEITEGAYTSNPQRIIEIVGQLQARGFAVLMDDFGSGYSSLSMLKELPVDVLKIDLSFLDDKSETARGGNILNSVVRMAKWLRIPVVVEGVETREQVDFLRTIGCDYVQGYYFSKPIPVEQYENLLAQGQLPAAVSGGNRLWQSEDDINELLMSSNQQFNFLFNAMFSGVGFYERQGDDLELIRANDGLAKMIGLTIEQLMSGEARLLSCLDPADRETFFATLDKAHRTKAMQTAVVRRAVPGGVLMWLRMFASVIVHEEHREVLFIGWEDILKSQAQFLRTQNERSTFPGGLCTGRTTDIGTVIFYYLSDWIMDMIGLTWATMKNQVEDTTFWRNLLGADFAIWFRDMILKAADATWELSGTYDTMMPDGKFHRLLMTFCAQRDEGGVVTFCAGLREREE